MDAPRPPRVVSLLPAGTDILLAMNLGHLLVAVSHECTLPPEFKHLPPAMKCNFPSDELSSAAIDKLVMAAAATATSIFEVDAELMRRLAPTHVLTQDLCGVCAVAEDGLASVLATLPNPVRPAVICLTAKSVDGLFCDIRAVAAAVQHPELGEDLVSRLTARLEELRSRMASLERIPVACLEWLEPVYTGGHWLPECVALAGGVDVLSVAGIPSVAVPDVIAKLREAKPRIIILAPCGFNVARSLEEASRTVVALPGWDALPAVQSHRVWAVWAHKYFSGASTALIDGVELLAKLIHPEAFPPEDSVPALEDASILPGRTSSCCGTATSMR